MAVSEKSLANLKPPFQDGNGVAKVENRPPGQPSKSRSNPIQVLRVLADPSDNAPYARKDLKAMAKGQHILRALLASEVLCAIGTRERWAIDRQGKAYRAGTDPEPGKSFERILDQLVGKPRQTVKIEAEPPRAVIDIKADIAQLIIADPSITALVRAQLPVMEGPITSTGSVLPSDNDGGGTPQSDGNAGGGAPSAQVLQTDSPSSDITPEKPLSQPGNDDPIVDSERVG